MPTHPRLTVGLPVYNGEKYLAESLDALLGQSYEDFELIISDNASEDGTESICRCYERRDARIRYVRQPRNMGAAANHRYLVDEARGELFKWASYDDLYARDLLSRCVKLLDEHPDVVLAHSWTAAIDDSGKLTQASEYPLATDSERPPERFWTVLFRGGKQVTGGIAADDTYGIIRTSLLRRIPAQGTFYNSDRVFVAELALHGRFLQVPDWLYFRRDHSRRPQPQHAAPTVRSWCVNQDPGRANRLRYPTPLLVAEYFWEYIAAIQRAPLSASDRRECYRYLMEWTGPRAVRAAGRIAVGRSAVSTEPAVLPPLPDLSIDSIIPGREAVSR